MIHESGVAASPTVLSAHGGAAARRAYSELAPGLFRVASAGLIAVFCYEQSAGAAAAPALPSAPLPSANTLSGIAAAWLALLDPSQQWRLAAICAAALALGVAHRASALALLVVLGTMHDRWPVESSLDLSVASFMALWLLILPGTSKRSRPGTQAASDLGVQLFLCHVALLHLSTPLWTRMHPGWQPHSAIGLAMSIVPGLMALGGGGLARFAAVGLLLVVHLSLAGQAQGYAHALIASSAILALRHARLGPGAARAEPAQLRAHLDGHAACAVALSAAVCVVLTGQLFGLRDQLGPAVELLRDLGHVLEVYRL